MTQRIRANARLEITQVSRVSVGGQLHSEWEITIDGRLSGYVRGVPSTATGGREYVVIAIDHKGRRVYHPVSYSGLDGNVHAVATLLDRAVSL